MFSDGRGALGGLKWNHLKLSTINLCNCWRGHHFQYPSNSREKCFKKDRYETSSNQQQEVELPKQRMKRWTSNSNPPPESRYKVARQPDNAMAAMSDRPFLLRHFPLFSLIASMKLLQLGIHWNLPYVNAQLVHQLVHFTSRQRYQKLPAECPSGSGPTARWNAKVGWSGRRLAGGRPPIGCPVARRFGDCWNRGLQKCFWHENWVQ